MFTGRERKLILLAGFLTAVVAFTGLFELKGILETRYVFQLAVFIFVGTFLLAIIAEGLLKELIIWGKKKEEGGA